MSEKDSMGYLNRAAKIFNGEVVFLKLLGYSSGNKKTEPKERYQDAKMPIEKQWTSSIFCGHSITDLVEWIAKGGWVGLRIPEDHIIIDVDDAREGRIINDLLVKNAVIHHSIRTPKGYQFILKDSGVVDKQNAKMLTECGFVVDYRLQNRGQIVIPTPNTEGRTWGHVDQRELDIMPFWFTPLRLVSEKNPRPFEVPISEGSRNTVLFQHACRLKKIGCAEKNLFNVIDYMGTNLCIPSIDHNEINSIVNSAMKYEDQQAAKSTANQNEYYTPDANFLEKKEKPLFNRTDLGNAKRLIYRHGDDLRYCYAYGCWFVWDGRRWRTDETGEIERRSKETVLSIYQEAIESTEDQRIALNKHATVSESRNKIVAMIASAQSEPGIAVTPKQLDGDIWKLNCLNGVVDLKTGRLLPHSREELNTKLVQVIYDPNADCPTWKGFLNRIMQDEAGNVKVELIHFLQKSIGYALAGDITEQCMFFLYGGGKNGKSTFINTVKDLLGDYGMQSSTETFMVKQSGSGIPNDLARLKGARLVSATESEEGRRLAESLVKQLTGGEPIAARFLHKEYFEFVPTFKIFFVSNHKPQIKGTDRGIWRRIRLIPFSTTIRDDEDDKSLPDKLKSELPGILKWAVEGCLMWQREKLGAPKEVVDATAAYREEMDTMAHFLEDCCVIDSAAKVSTKDLYNSYKNWAEENGEHPLAKNKFIGRLKERMQTQNHHMKEMKTNKNRGWVGIGIIYDSDIPDLSDPKQSSVVTDISSYKNATIGKQKRAKEVEYDAD
jgi:putative DNA primase/helicase